MRNVYGVTLPNMKYGHLMPPEDSWLYEGNVFCVADGITRDPLAPRDWRGRRKEEILKRYPNPSGARLASDLFCRTFVRAVSADRPSVGLVREAFIKGNRAIRSLNRKHVPNPDYLVDDLFGCVASGGVISGKWLYWGAITDCGVAVFSRNGRRKFITPVWIAPVDLFMRRHHLDVRKPEVRLMIRRDFRNHPEKKVEGRHVSYGALTGEPAAEAYMHFGRIRLARGDLIVFFSDGFQETIRRKDIFSALNHGSPSLVDQSLVPYSLALARKDFTGHGLERTILTVKIPG